VRKHDGEPIGAGLLVADRLVLTCAHVINQALGMADESQAQPSEAVRLDFPFLPAEPYMAKVVRWIPVAQNGSGDIAGLALSAAPPSGAAPMQLVVQAELWDTDFRVLGFPAGYDNGVYSHGSIRGQLAHDYVQLEAEGGSNAPRLQRIRYGASGKRRSWSVVAADRNPKSSRFHDSCDRIGHRLGRTQPRAQWLFPKRIFSHSRGRSCTTSPFYIARSRCTRAARLIKQAV
jgi:hypothetical protein